MEKIAHNRKDERNWAICRTYLLQDTPQRTIAAEHGITVQAVSQIMKRYGVYSARHKSTAPAVRPWAIPLMRRFVPEYFETDGYKALVVDCLMPAPQADAQWVSE